VNRKPRRLREYLKKKSKQAVGREQAELNFTRDLASFRSNQPGESPETAKREASKRKIKSQGCRIDLQGKEIGRYNTKQ